MYVCVCHAVTERQEHIDYLETELELLETLGEPLYLARYAEPPSGDG